MAYGLRFGNAFTPGAGVTLERGARGKETFARQVERTKLAHTSRQLDLQEARLELDRDLAEESRRADEENKKFMRKKWDKEFRKQTKQWKQDRDIRRQNADTGKKQEDRLEKQAEADREREQADRKREELERRRQRAETARLERNSLGQMGAWELQNDETPPAGYYPYRSVDGRVWAMPNAQKQAADKLAAEVEKARQIQEIKQQSAPTKSPEATRNHLAMWIGQVKTIDRKIKELTDAAEKVEGDIKKDLLTQIAELEQQKQQYESMISETINEYRQPGEPVRSLTPSGTESTSDWPKYPGPSDDLKDLFEGLL